MGNLLLPVGPRKMSGWEAHQHRNPRSSEPGTDFYCPIGTPVYAPGDGKIYGFGNTIGPATGRWVGIDLDNGQRFRAMHFSRIVRSSGRVKRGDLIAYSGASGYGDNDWSWNPNTGGAHTHVTLWPTHESRYGYHKVNGKDVPYTIDFMNYVGGSAAGGGTTPEEKPKPQGGKMVIYALREPDGLVVAIPEGGKVHNFSGVEEYERVRSTIAVVNGQRQSQGQALVTLPPPLTSIVRMDSLRLNDLIKVQGAFS